MGLAPRQREGQDPGRPLPWASVSISVLPTGAHPAPQAGILTVVPWLPEHLCEQKQRLRRTPLGNVENGGQRNPEATGWPFTTHAPEGSDNAPEGPPDCAAPRGPSRKGIRIHCPSGGFVPLPHEIGDPDPRQGPPLGAGPPTTQPQQAGILRCTFPHPSAHQDPRPLPLVRLCRPRSSAFPLAHSPPPTPPPLA